jgi:lantibiotic transport system permease protein
MTGFILSFRSEFYKSRKTLGFWCAILLPLLICSLILWGSYVHMRPAQPMILWLEFAGSILNVMGSLLLPMYIIFVAYSVNSLEHRADTWKTLFSLPISKWSVYAAKYFYSMFLVLICLLLFSVLNFGYGNLLGILRPELKFSDYAISDLLFQVYLKLFLSSLGILSIQFLLSLLWSDFLKPMGVGFVCTITGVIAGAAHWKYAYLFPYSHPMMAITGISPKQGKAMQFDANLWNKEIFVSLIVAVVVFIAGYFIVEKRSVK